jgi:hypothetical protein
MIGFEVKINDQIIDAAIKNGVVSVIFTRIKNKDQDDIYLDISGLNSDTDENPRWMMQNLKVGDTISVLVKEMSKPSKYEIRKWDTDEEMRNARKVERFHSLQKELQEKGLI